MKPVRLAWWIWAVVVVALIAGAFVVAGCAAAQNRGVVFDCRQLAELMERLSSYRDAGAELDRTLAVIRLRIETPEQHWQAIRREARLVWTEGLPGEAAMQRTYDRCRARLGDMGFEG